MTSKLTFLGAAGNVTGSKFLFESGTHRLLVDCGLFQEHDLLHRNWEEPAFSPGEIQAVLLTHAHLDHCGWLPRLVKLGFKGRIYCTAATAEIAAISLEDAGRLQEEDADFKKRRHQREGRQGPYPEEPLYTRADAVAVGPLFSPVAYGQRVALGAGLSATFRDAGHVLGSAMIKMSFESGSTIVFSGDIGRPQNPLQDDPSTFRAADYIVMEATYGTQTHEPEAQAVEKLERIVRETAARGGNTVIPSFALERAQNVLYYLNGAMRAGRIPKITVFLDSPLAAGITAVFRRHPEALSHEIGGDKAGGRSPFDFPELQVTGSIGESKAINSRTGPCVIIAGSGMATGGRIKHHLAFNISRPESSIVFVGYQAQNTLGREITDGAKSVRLFGEMREVKAHIEKIDGFSAHADSGDLLNWLAALRKPPKELFLTHSEPSAAEGFSKLVTQRLGWRPVIPVYKDEYSL
jgi:metallo-beta-lactamase family protein